MTPGRRSSSGKRARAVPHKTVTTAALEVAVAGINAVFRAEAVFGVA